MDSYSKLLCLNTVYPTLSKRYFDKLTTLVNAAVLPITYIRYSRLFWWALKLANSSKNVIGNF